MSNDKLAATFHGGGTRKEYWLIRREDSDGLISYACPICGVLTPHEAAAHGPVHTTHKGD